MVRIDAKAFWLCVPALADVLRGGAPFQWLAALGEVIGHQEGLEVCPDVLRGLVVILLHGGFFAGTVQAFSLAIGPGMMGFGEARVEALVPTDALQPMVERVLIALPVGELDAGIRPDGVDLVGHGGDAGAPCMVPPRSCWPLGATRQRQTCPHGRWPRTESAGLLPYGPRL
jgi:hypothetical protein